MAERAVKGDLAVKDQDSKEPSVWGVLLVGVVGGAVLLGSYLHLRHGFVVGQLKDHADLGNALAPMVAFLTLLAVVAALWSVQVQRADLALQRKELQETRDEMVEQRKQFERTAKAQEALAESQKRLAEAQVHSNYLAIQAVAAQRKGNALTLMAAFLQAKATIEELRARSGNMGESLQREMRDHMSAIGKLIDDEQEAAAQILREQTSPPDGSDA